MRPLYQDAQYKLNNQKHLNHNSYLYQIHPKNSCRKDDTQQQQIRSYRSGHMFVYKKETNIHYKNMMRKFFFLNQPYPNEISISMMQMSTRVSKRKDPCPFDVLGVPKKSPYNIVKKAFFKLALQHHPDTQNNQNNNNDDNDDNNGNGDDGGSVNGDGTNKNIDPAELFHRIRTAFESLMEDPETGIAIRRPVPEDEKASGIWKDNEEFDSWFKAETGYNAPFMFEMDPETMREVAAVTENLEGGGLDRGGMWHLAKMVSQNVKDNDKSSSMTGGILQLESGEVQDEKKTRLSRRRRRPR